MRELLVNRLKLAADNLWELTVFTASCKYRGFIEDWSDEELILKYVGAESADRCIVERWIPIDTVIEVAYIREPNLDESFMSLEYENTLRFANENPEEQSDTVIEEIFEDFNGFDFLDDFTGEKA